MNGNLAAIDPTQDPVMAKALAMTPAASTSAPNIDPANDPIMQKALGMTPNASVVGLSNPQQQQQQQSVQAQQYPTNGPLNRLINQSVPALQNIPLVGNTAADMLRGYQGTGIPLPMSLMQGVGQGVQGALSGGAGLYNRLPSSLQGIPGLPSTQGNLPNVPNPQALQNPISPATAFVGNMASSMMLPGDIGMASKAASLAPRLPGAVNALAPMADRAALGAGYGALYGSANGNSPTAGNIALSAALPGLAPYAIRGAQNVLNGNAIKAVARPVTNYLMGNLQARGLSRGSPLLNPANVPARQAAIGNTPVSLGEFINSPSLTGEYNKSTQQPFSDQAQNMQGKLQDVKDSANGLMSSLLGNTDPANINSTILDNLQNNQQNWSDLANKKYALANQTANQYNFDSSFRPLTQSTAQGLVDAATLAAQKNEPHWLNSSPSDLNFIRQLAQGPTGGSLSSTLQDAIQTRGEIGQRQADAAANPKTARAAAAYADLLGSNTQDLENNIDQSGSPTLQAAWKDANDTYANNVVPYKARDIMPLLDKSDTTDLTTALMRPENATIVQHMPQNIRNLVMYQELNKAQTLNNGEIETVPSKLSNNSTRLLSSYPGVVNRFLDPQTTQRFNNFNTAYNATKNAVPYVYPPATGFQLKKFAEQAKPYLYGGLASLSGFLHPGLALAGLAVPPALLGLNRGIAKTMTNPLLRQAYGAVTQDANGNIIPNALARRQFINQALPYKPTVSGNSLNRFNPMIANALAQGNQTQ